MNVRIKEITKEFHRTYNDGNYGSVKVGTVITMCVEEPLSTADRKRLEEEMAEHVREDTMKDLQKWLDAQEREDAP